MDTFQPPPPLLPDLVSSPTIIPPHLEQTTMTGCYQKQKVDQPLESSTHEESSAHQLQTMTSSLSSGDESVVQMMMDCKMGTTECSAGIQPNPIPSWPTPSSSSSSSTPFNDYPPQQCLLPPPPSPPQPPVHAVQIPQPPQLPNIVPGKLVEEFEEMMRNDDDPVVLTNSVCLLFVYSIDSVRGAEVCQRMSATPDMMSRLYYVCERYKDHDVILCYATGILTSISKYDEGRAAILGCNGSQMSSQYSYGLSMGVESLIRSLQSSDSNVVIFAITAIHNLLLDRRVSLQEIAKEQIKHGLKHIVQLLDDQCFSRNYEFKVIVLDCLQILAYGNRENRLTIKKSGGPYLLLRTIKENFDNQPTEELIETASRVLKSLSACPSNKVDIIEHGGINVLTHCIRTTNHEILKTCLWTLRNLSDVINNIDHGPCINQLVERLLHILDEYTDQSCIITCALGILANLTCNNESIKQYICEYNGVELLLGTIAVALRDGRDFRIIDKEILEPAICALCHLMNQTHNPNLAEDAKLVIMRNFDMFRELMSPTRMISDDLSKAVEKLVNLTFKSN